MVVQCFVNRRIGRYRQYRQAESDHSGPEPDWLGNIGHGFFLGLGQPEGCRNKTNSPLADFGSCPKINLPGSLKSFLHAVGVIFGTSVKEGELDSQTLSRHRRSL
jgi:hypothetical protein